jgi:hypothetical protein
MTGKESGGKGGKNGGEENRERNRYKVDGREKKKARIRSLECWVSVTL